MSESTFSRPSTATILKIVAFAAFVLWAFYSI